MQSEKIVFLGNNSHSGRAPLVLSLTQWQNQNMVLRCGPGAKKKGGEHGLKIFQKISAI